MLLSKDIFLYTNFPGFSISILSSILVGFTDVNWLSPDPKVTPNPIAVPAKALPLVFANLITVSLSFIIK